MVIAIGLSREAWGPRFWKILHRLAEQSGRQNHAIQHNDEAEAWIALLKSQAQVMPCALCKQHQLEWLHKEKTDFLRETQGEQRRNLLREWLWEAHDRVNQMNAKTSPPLEELPNLYPKTSIEQEVQELGTMFSLGLSKLQLKVEDIYRWRQALSRLRGMQGM